MAVLIEAPVLEREADETPQTEKRAEDSFEPVTSRRVSLSENPHIDRKQSWIITDRPYHRSVSDDMMDQLGLRAALGKNVNLSELDF